MSTDNPKAGLGDRTWLDDLLDGKIDGQEEGSWQANLALLLSVVFTDILPEPALGSDLQTVIFQLVKRAEAVGRLNELFAAVVAINPDKSRLKRLAHKLLPTLRAVDTNTLHIPFPDTPLTAPALATTLTALTSLFTKSQLIAQGRYGDLIQYTQTHDPRFEAETSLVISALPRRSGGEASLEWESTDETVTRESAESMRRERSA